MITTLVGLVGMSAFSSLIFILGLFGVNESEKWAGVIIGILFMAAGVAGFTVSIIMFTVHYLQCFSPVMLGM